jgi:hypothetical protein
MATGVRLEMTTGCRPREPVYCIPRELALSYLRCTESALNEPRTFFGLLDMRRSIISIG